MSTVPIFFIQLFHPPQHAPPISYLFNLFFINRTFLSPSGSLELALKLVRPWIWDPPASTSQVAGIQAQITS